MIPDFGKHAFYIWSSYGIGLSLLLMLLWASWRKCRQLQQSIRRQSMAKRIEENFS
jgi:heme exporter protein CcmD